MLFLYTATIVAHPTYAGNVMRALQGLVDAETESLGAMDSVRPLKQCTPIRLNVQTTATLVMFDAALSPYETVISEAKGLIQQAHPLIERGSHGRLFSDVAASLDEKAVKKLRAESWRWLPEINVSLISNVPESAEAAFAYWTRLPHNCHAAAF